MYISKCIRPNRVVWDFPLSLLLFPLKGKANASTQSQLTSTTTNAARTLFIPTHPGSKLLCVSPFSKDRKLPLGSKFEVKIINTQNTGEQPTQPFLTISEYQKPIENPLRNQWFSLHILTPLVIKWFINGFEKIRKWLKMVRIGIRLYWKIRIWKVGRGLK